MSQLDRVCAHYVLVNLTLVVGFLREPSRSALRNAHVRLAHAERYASQFRNPTAAARVRVLVGALRLVLLRAQGAPEARCCCGASLGYYLGAGAAGVLCPGCDVVHVAELEQGACLVSRVFTSPKP